MTCRRQFLKQLGALALVGAAAPAVLAQLGTPSAPRSLYRTGEVMVQDHWGGPWRRGDPIVVTHGASSSLGRITAVGRGTITVEWGTP